MANAPKKEEKPEDEKAPELTDSEKEADKNAAEAREQGEQNSDGAVGPTTIGDLLDHVLERIEQELEDEPDKWEVQVALGGVTERVKKLESE